MIQIRANMNNDTIQKGALVDILFAQQKTDCLEGRGKNKYINFFFFCFPFFCLWKAHLEKMETAAKLMAKVTCWSFNA